MQQETANLPPFDVCTEPVPEDATCEKLVLTNVESITYAQIKHISADPVLSAIRVAIGPPMALSTQTGGELTVWVKVPCTVNGQGCDGEASAVASGGMIQRIKGGCYLNKTMLQLYVFNRGHRAYSYPGINSSAVVIDRNENTFI